MFTNTLIKIPPNSPQSYHICDDSNFYFLAETAIYSTSAVSCMYTKLKPIDKVQWSTILTVNIHLINSSHVTLFF